MANTPNRRVPPKVLSEDIKVFHALGTIKGYAPHDPDLSLQAITATYNELLADQVAFVQGQIAVDRLRDKLIATEHRIHGQVGSSKDAVRGQFGDDSEEIATMGLKRASERKRGSAKGKPAAE